MEDELYRLFNLSSSTSHGFRDDVGREPAPQQMVKHAAAVGQRRPGRPAPFGQDGLDGLRFVLGTQPAEHVIDDRLQHAAGVQLVRDTDAAASLQLAGGTDIRGGDAPVRAA